MIVVTLDRKIVDNFLKGLAKHEHMVYRLRDDDWEDEDDY